MRVNCGGMFGVEERGEEGWSPGRLVEVMYGGMIGDKGRDESGSIGWGRGVNRGPVGVESRLEHLGTWGWRLRVRARLY